MLFKCSSTSNVLTLWSEGESGLEKNKPTICVVYIFRVEFLKRTTGIIIVTDHSGIFLAILKFLWTSQQLVGQSDLAFLPVDIVQPCKKLH